MDVRIRPVGESRPIYRYSIAADTIDLIVDTGIQDQMVNNLAAVIGPVLSFATYLGGDGDDWAWGLALDVFGNPYITGRTRSMNFPADHPHQSCQGKSDVFIAAIWGVGVSVADQLSPVPDRFVPGQNFPNPFNPLTTIPYSVPENTHIRLAVYNVNGQPLRVLADGRVPPGHHQAGWDGLNIKGDVVSSGIYLCRMDAGRITLTRKLVFMK